MSERILRPRPLPGKTPGGRRPISSAAVTEMETAAAAAAAEILPRLEEMIRDRLLHVAEHIPEEWMEGGKLVRGEQEVVLDTKESPPFFTVTTRKVRE